MTTTPAPDPMHTLAHAEAHAAVSRIAARTCSVDGCGEKHSCRGLCAHHYAQARRSGTLALAKPPTTEERFWPKVDRRRDDECWPWIASLTGAGYAQFYIEPGRKSGLGHRYAYELLVGPIPAGLVLDHLCRNRACVNPAHLEPVTHQENVRRGDASVVNGLRFSQRTHCPKGHPYDEENTYPRPNAGRHGGGGRGCRACSRASHARRNAAKRAAREAS